MRPCSVFEVSRRSDVVLRPENCEQRLPSAFGLLASNGHEVRQGLIVGSEDREAPIMFIRLEVANPQFRVPACGGWLSMHEL
jgi:hypothetical protein